MEALHIFSDMVSEGMHCHPNEFHFGSVFRGGVICNLGYGEQVHCLSVKSKLDRNSYEGCSLSDIYAWYSKLESASKVFNRIEVPDLVAWNSLINAYSVEGLLSEAMILFSEMRVSGLRPDDVTIKGLLCACLGSDALVEQFTPWLNWVWMDAFEYAILYSACILGVWISPLQWTSLMRQMTNIVLTACVQHRYLEEVFKLSSLLHRSVSSVDRISLNNVLSASAELGYFEMVKQVHAYAIKVGLLGDTMLSNVLIDTYAKCGSLDDAKTL
jgi:pentatricopeptide repeat protein